MEELDAFYATSSVTVGSTAVENKGTITLTRPLAQLNFADNATKPEMGTHKAIVTFHSIATSFNPFTGEVEMLDMDKAFVFTDFPAETLLIDGNTYYYLSSNYFFTPQTGVININATIDLQNTDGTSIKTVELSDITLEKNKKTNVTGSIIQQPETWSVWDGEAKSQPAIDVQNRYIIDEAADIAWLSENGATLTSNSIFLQTKDIDMNDVTISSIKLPAGSTYDGGGKTIKNYANSLFGDATALTVKNLAVAYDGKKVIENINFNFTEHWTNKSNSIIGTVLIDEKEYLFLGYDRDILKLDQKSLDIDAFSTTVQMGNDIISLNLKFTSPVLINDLELLTRPVSYLAVDYKLKDGKNHNVKIDIPMTKEMIEECRYDSNHSISEYADRYYPKR